MSTSSTGSGIIEAAAKTSGRTTTINSPSPLSATTPSGTAGNIKHHLEKDKKRKKSNLIRLSTSPTKRTTTPNKSSQSMDLAPRGPSVVQLRPVRPVFSTLSASSLSSSTNKPNNNNTSSSVTSSPGGLISTTGGGGGGSPIISVNRTTPAGTNVTILPARGVTTTVGNTQQGGIMPTYQITRVGVGNVVRPGGGGAVVGPGQQPASITVTPLPTSNLTNLRLAAGTPVNNGTWLQASGVQGFARAIAVGGRPVRPADGKMIHIPQHVTQLQVVDGKGSILKPQIGTPIVNIRGPLPGGATSGQSLTLPLPPFTIRTTNITNISAAIQPRPPPNSTPSSSSSGTLTSTPVHKVITQHDHNAPIQFVNATNKNAIGASIPKLSTVCLTLSTNATLAPNNSSPVVAVSSRQAAAGLTPSLIVTPSSLTANNTTTTTATTLPITKVYPVGRDGSSMVMDNMFSSGSAVSVSTVNVNLSTISTNSSNAPNPPCVVVAASSSVGAHHHPQHVLLHTTTPTINVHTGQNPSSGGGLPPSNLVTGGIAPSYFVDKNFQMNILPHQSRPITLEKKIDPKSLPPGSMIITAAATTTTGNTVTIPLTQHLTNLAHLGHHHAAGNTHNNIVNPNNNSSTTIIATSTTSATSSSSSTPPSSHNHLPHQILAQFNPHSVTVTPSSTSIPIPIPAHVISQSILGVTTSSSSLGSVLTVTTTTISSTSGTSSSSTGSSSTSSIISSSSSTPNIITSATSILPSTMTSSSTSSTFTSSSTATTTTTAPPAQSPNHNNPPTSSTSSNNNNSTKATHSPRPSILRKRELGGDHHGHTSASRAQRNLSLQLNFSTSNSTNFTSSSNKENSSLLDKFSSGLSGSTSTSITSSGGGGGATTGTGVSILKKEFQPPTEESSWQSVSSNSSSGSSTISTTSETAELQLQQQLTGGIGGGGGADLNLSTMSLPHSSEISASAFLGLGSSLLTNSILSGGGGKNSSSTTTTSTTSTIGGLTAGGLSISLANIGSGVGGGNSSTTIPTSSSSSSSQNQNQNGVLRTTNQPRSRSSSTSVGAKGANKDVERLKNKDKDLDAVSPRKKPRKQQLTSSDLLEAASPEIYYQGKGKRFRKGDLMDFTEGITEKEKVPVDPIPEEPPPPRIVYYVKRPHMSLVQSNCFPPKPLTTHFQRYCDVKARDEKRPTISELANQKNILEKVGGWRVKLMTNQMQELVDNENGVVDDCSNLLNRLENKVGVGPSRGDRDLNIVMELLKGNIQRCKVIRDQMSDSKALAVKILDHKVTVTEVITKHSCKRPMAKKRVL